MDTTVSRHSVVLQLFYQFHRSLHNDSPLKQCLSAPLFFIKGSKETEKVRLMPEDSLLASLELIKPQLFPSMVVVYSSEFSITDSQESCFRDSKRLGLVEKECNALI